VVLCGEGRERFDRIVTNGEERDVVLIEVGSNLLQLNELGLAVGSPARAAVEDHERPSACPAGMQVDDVAGLIR
jgi:hypothetical protein